ncbi:(2Fe-2S)-binding protein [Phytoactinopolyspora mesophila]|uniref:(2Fe-2S)-binding protein n=1 Tax=Phytoactinopolyspora mesophila TaxID=2650750 RepID=A0A7K3M2N7_9ACTN|nr:(2Fe-2S)-binding protein [Phytoactinopolyspora mesophila]NDL57555.1 (2Fe-2S)-binding protein [Phytoactinopolyspora mesophila]
MTGPQTFTFDGREIPFDAGQSVGAALVLAGVRSWRTTRGSGRPRGIFCGIGVCFDCLITIDGRANLRACTVPARSGLDVRSQEGDGRADLHT